MFFSAVLKIKNLVLTHLGKDPLSSLSSCSISSSGLFHTDILIILGWSWPEATKLWAAYRRCLPVGSAEKTSVCVKDRHGFWRGFGNPESTENMHLHILVWANLTAFNFPHPVIIRSVSSRHFCRAMCRLTFWCERTITEWEGKAGVAKCLNSSKYTDFSSLLICPVMVPRSGVVEEGRERGCCHLGIKG